jgi:hypothetical protein
MTRTTFIRREIRLFATGDPAGPKSLPRRFHCPEPPSRWVRRVRGVSLTQLAA